MSDFLTDSHAAYRDGTVKEEARDQNWPPHIKFLVWERGTKAIWRCYRIGRWFPMEFWYCTDPRGADCESEEAQKFCFDVRELPSRFIGRYELNHRVQKNYLIEAPRVWNAHRQVIWRAVKAGHDFMAHNRAERQRQRDDLKRPSIMHDEEPF